MYEQSSATLKPNEDELMNMPVSAQKAPLKLLKAFGHGQDQDIEDVKNLQSKTSGSLFLSSATKTTEDFQKRLERS